MKWIDVKGFEGLYKVNNLGDVITNYNKNGKCGHKLSPFVDKDGYFAVKLYKDGKCFNRRINRLVAEAFVPNPKNKPYVNHIDCDRKNNNVINLEWCTAEENVHHSMQFGRYKGHGQKKVICMDKLGIYCQIFDSIHEASRNKNVPTSNIVGCCNGKRRTAGGYKWQYFQEVGD